MSLVSLLLLLLLLCVAVPSRGAAAHDSVLLKDVQVLTLHRGSMTAGRRTAPMAQLSCVGGSAQASAARVETVQCTNQGFDGRDYAWRCVAQLPETLRLGKTEVLCEGYGYPDDPYILRGSCGLEYHLESVALQPQTVVSGPRVAKQQQATVTRDASPAEDVATTFLIFFCVLIVVVVVLVAASGRREAYRGQRPTPLQSTIVYAQTPPVYNNNNYATTPLYPHYPACDGYTTTTTTTVTEPTPTETPSVSYASTKRREEVTQIPDATEGGSSVAYASTKRREEKDIPSSGKRSSNKEKAVTFSRSTEERESASQAGTRRR